MIYIQTITFFKICIASNLSTLNPIKKINNNNNSNNNNNNNNNNKEMALKKGSSIKEIH